MLKLHRIVKSLASFVLITAFLGCAATPKRESTGEYIDDSAITTKVKAAIFDESTLKTLQISVKTNQGVVKLSGSVDSAHSKRKASEVAGSVNGVVSVENDLVVK